MNERDKEKLSLAIYDIIVGIKDTISLPTHETLAVTLGISIILCIVSAISQLIGFPTLISWYGSLLCAVVLTVLLWVERAENNALMKAYETARKKAMKAASTTKKIAQGKQRKTRREK